MLVGSDGYVTSIMDYNASGDVMCNAPRDRDPFGFAGGIDAGNRLWKLGARFYDSDKNSFIQQDRYMGDVSEVKQDCLLHLTPLIPARFFKARPPSRRCNLGQGRGFFCFVKCAKKDLCNCRYQKKF